HQIVDKAVSAEEIARDPFEVVAGQGPAANPAIPRPADIFGAERRNSRGWDLTDPVTVAAVDARRAEFAAPHGWHAGGDGKTRGVVNPASPREVVGEVVEANAKTVGKAVGVAVKAQPGW